jgi:hypothetical protein
MWTTPQKSPQTKPGITATQGSGPSEDHPEEEEGGEPEPFAVPAIISENSMFSQLYHKIYKSQEKVSAQTKHQERRRELSLMKQTITSKVKEASTEAAFSKKFQRTVSCNAKIIRRDN